MGSGAQIATRGNAVSEHSSATNEPPRRIDELLMVAHQHRENGGCVVAVNPALGTPSSLAGGVKAHPVGRTLSDVMFELGALHQQSEQTDVCRPNASIRRLNRHTEASIHKIIRHKSHSIYRRENPIKMAGDAEDRAALVNRQLPEMTLSTADNPLTAPKPPPGNLSTVERAQYRFQVKGNAIST